MGGSSGGGGKPGGVTGEVGSQVLSGGAINVMPDSVQGPMKEATGWALDPLGTAVTGGGGGKGGAKGGGNGGGQPAMDSGTSPAVNPANIGTTAGSVIKSPILGKDVTTPDQARTAAQTGKPVADLGVYRTLLQQAIGGING